MLLAGDTLRSGGDRYRDGRLSGNRTCNRVSGDYRYGIFGGFGNNLRVMTRRRVWEYRTRTRFVPATRIGRDWFFDVREPERMQFCLSTWCGREVRWGPRQRRGSARWIQYSAPQNLQNETWLRKVLQLRSSATPANAETSVGADRHQTIPFGPWALFCLIPAATPKNLQLL